MERYSEDTKQVILTVDDIKNMESFMNFFEIPIPPYLNDVFVDIYQNTALTFEQQKNFRAKFAMAVIESNHPLFQDAAFDEVKNTMKSINYDTHFEEDLKDILTK
jgi:hypothetical protein